MYKLPHRLPHSQSGLLSLCCRAVVDDDATICGATSGRETLELLSDGESSHAAGA